MKTEKQSGSPLIIYILCRWWQKYILYSVIFIFVQYIFCIKLFAPLYCNFLVVIHVTNCYTRGGMVLTCDKGQKQTLLNLIYIIFFVFRWWEVQVLAGHRGLTPA